jgi:hypothetical protein
MTIKRARRLLGLALVLAGAALNSEYLVEWMRHSKI